MTYSTHEFATKIRTFSKKKGIRLEDIETKAQDLVPGEEITYEQLNKLFEINLFLDLKGCEAIDENEMAYILSKYFSRGEVEKVLKFVRSI